MPARTLTSTIMALAVTLGAASGAAAKPFAGETIDGPSPDIQRLGGLGLARDGSGGVVYIKRDGGVDHVFVSRLVLGAPSPPERVDTGRSEPASSAVIAAGDGGRLAVAFVSATSLYASVLGSQGRRFSAPQMIAGSASEPALGMSIHGAGYLAFTEPGLPARVRVAHLPLRGASFDLAGEPLNVDSSRNAGDSEAKRARVHVSADGTALVAWSEDAGDGRTHVYARRVLGTALSVAPQDVTLDSLDGHPGGSADSPQVRLQDNGSFGWIVFRQSFSDGTGQRTRTLARRLVGSVYDPAVKVDGLGFPAEEGSDPPSFDLSGYGDGVVATGLSSSHRTIAAPLSGDAVQRADRHANAITPFPTAAIGESGRGLVAWQESTGPSDPAVVHGRELNQASLAPDTVLSTPALGAVDASLGLEARADQPGDVALAFVQGGIADRRISLAEVTQAPRAPVIATTSGFLRQPRPRISWQPNKEFFSVLTYRVILDGHLIGSTTASRLTPRRRISEGVHRLVVRAIDRHGQTTPSRPSRLRVDSTPPRVKVAVRSSVVSVGVVDVAGAGARGGESSGVGRVHISWGDGTGSSTAGSHHYSGGAHTLSVRATDRAGNVTRVRRSVHPR